MGNSTDMILPKALLGELGIATGQAMEVRVEAGHIIATPVVAEQRAGWADAARAASTVADPEAEEWGELGNGDDASLRW